VEQFGASIQEYKRHQEIPQVKMFYLNVYKNIWHELYTYKYELYAFITYIESIKFMSYDLFFYKFGLNIFPWGISSCLTIPCLFKLFKFRALWNEIHIHLHLKNEWKKIYIYFEFQAPCIFQCLNDAGLRPRFLKIRCTMYVTLFV